jgi:hypothetical protein
MRYRRWNRDDEKITTTHRIGFVRKGCLCRCQILGWDFASCVVTVAKGIDAAELDIKADDVEMFCEGDRKWQPNVAEPDDSNFSDR